MYIPYSALLEKHVFRFYAIAKLTAKIPNENAIRYE
jgi:hypothetical protein